MVLSLILYTFKICASVAIQRETAILKYSYWEMYAFAINWFSPNINNFFLNELTFQRNILSFIKLLTFFCAVFMSLLMV